MKNSIRKFDIFRLLVIFLAVSLLAGWGQTAPLQAAPEQQTAPITISGVGLQLPESALYDSQNDVYLVSNVNGTPLGEDNNGFISRVSPEGKVLELKWISGGQKGVTLNGPKGMAIVDGLLYTTDLNTVRSFDLKTGQPKENIVIPDTGFLNDLIASADGKLYVSEMGVRSEGDNFVPTGKDAIYRIDTRSSNKTAQAIAKGQQLNNPNGLSLLADGSLVVAPYSGSKDLYTIKADGTTARLKSLPGGQMDGLVTLPGDVLLISSWETSKVYQVKPDGTVSDIFSGKTAADIGYDTKRQRLLMPILSENSLIFQSVAAPALPSTGLGNAGETGNNFGLIGGLLGATLLVAVVTLGTLRRKSVGR